MNYHKNELYSKYGITYDLISHYLAKGILERVPPTMIYFTVVKPIIIDFNPIKIMNNLALFKTNYGKFAVRDPLGYSMNFDTKEGAVLFMTKNKIYATKTGKGHRMTFDEGDLIRLMAQFSDNDCIGITAKRMLGIV